MSTPVSPLEKLHFACSSNLPGSFVLVTDAGADMSADLRMEDLRAIRLHVEELQRALHGGRDRDKERREFVRAGAIAFRSQLDQSYAARSGFAAFACPAPEAVLMAEELAAVLADRGHL